MEYKICKNCIMDSSDPQISFDNEAFVIIAIILNLIFCQIGHFIVMAEMNWTKLSVKLKKK